MRRPGGAWCKLKPIVLAIWFALRKRERRGVRCGARAYGWTAERRRKTGTVAPEYHSRDTHDLWPPQPELDPRQKDALLLDGGFEGNPWMSEKTV